MKIGNLMILKIEGINEEVKRMIRLEIIQAGFDRKETMTLTC